MFKSSMYQNYLMQNKLDTILISSMYAMSDMAE